ncbi:MAG: HAD family phosphatase [Pseudomonadota bacterium]
MNFPPDLVIFDCDGVLVDSEPLTNAVIRDNLARHGLDVPMQEVVRLFVGGTMMGVRDTARGMGAALPDTWLEDVYDEIFDVLAREVEAIPGIETVLDVLEGAGIPVAVGSNGPHRKMEITLGRTGLASRLEGLVFSREDVAQPKPAPDVYLKAAAAAGVAPDRAVVIEDSPSGARAALAAGIYCFGYVAQTDPGRLEPVCDRLFDRMDDLPGLLGV